MCMFFATIFLRIFIAKKKSFKINGKRRGLKKYFVFYLLFYF